MLPILYGEIPAPYPPSEEQRQAGLVEPAYIAGGCAVFEGSPDFRCSACEHTWQSQPPRSHGVPE